MLTFKSPWRDVGEIVVAQVKLLQLEKALESTHSDVVETVVAQGECCHDG